MKNIMYLSLMIGLPLAGSFFILLIQGDEATVAKNARSVGLWTAGINFLLSLVLYQRFNPQVDDYQFVEHFLWIPQFNTYYHVGVDGLSLFFILLTTFLMPLCILASWETIRRRVKEYMIAFLVLESFLIGAFCALDLILFYIFFEAVLIPLFLVIGIWGGERRIYAAFKFFLYTLLGSIFMVLGVITIYLKTGTTDLTQLSSSLLSPDLQQWLWLAFFAAFAVKIPMWPFHTWLPDAHVEAPTAGSVILAGILLKLGGYGFLRLSLPLLPSGCAFFTPLMITLSLIAIVYTSLVALVQSDMKKLVAYSSIAHMGFVTLGLFTHTSQGQAGAVVQMLSHGLISAALFLCVGIIYDRCHSRDIRYFGGLVKLMPRYAVFFMFFILASIGLPGTSGFVGEFLVLLGAFQIHKGTAFVASIGIILSAAYGLFLYRRVIFGSLSPHLKDTSAPLPDLNMRELVILTPLAALILWLGLYPQPVISVIDRCLPLTYSKAPLP